MGEEREEEFDYQAWCLSQRCMARAQEGIPHNTERAAKWARQTYNDWISGTGPRPEVKRDADFPSRRRCLQHRLNQERRRKTKVIYYS
tara:strand:- start:1317 stop:1580 length:264 start_codon:yes stop_codon:yes gene_type:complete